ncbi:type II toxin-antitoxin system RelE/ParE family toxin [Bradyrhizobium cenepequi]|uniref:type II toxin-antitoxin system RelE/ParE family toxin n=1 Tax=Bradyrhizobium cenepequi TaxID=2821403 RepID=UPI001CE28C00|nr:type II toxin-antitoxin system RelE/ParE family toxin [Bradyrhizobium cenepequi]MCA6105904.1 type II toxin-antitoxin system RelE/ParE family toxin [Bradyrhizobium cenepequi]
MKLVWSRRALADLTEIATYYSINASPTIARSIEDRFLVVLDRIRRAPESAPRVSQRSSVRVVAVVRHPFRIFYRVRGEDIDILHIRHTSRRPFSPTKLD